MVACYPFPDFVVAPVAETVCEVAAGAVEGVGHDGVAVFGELGCAGVAFVEAVVVLQILKILVVYMVVGRTLGVHLLLAMPTIRHQWSRSQVSRGSRHMCSAPQTSRHHTADLLRAGSRTGSSGLTGTSHGSQPDRHSVPFCIRSSVRALINTSTPYSH